MTADHDADNSSVFDRSWLVESEEPETCPACGEIADTIEDGACLQCRRAQTPEIVLFEWFEIHPLGVEVCPGTLPPKEAWEALVLYLASNNDNLAWQVGATCNRYPKAYHADIYGWFATLLNRSQSTVEQYAYIERNVPIEARVGGLSIWHHRPVAKIKDSGKQAAYLEACKEHGWTISVFEDWLGRQGVEVEEYHYQEDRANRAYEDAQELYQARQRTRELESKVVALEAQNGENSRTIDPTTLPELDNLAQPIIGWLQSQTVNFSAVLIKRSGEVVIKP